MLASTRRERGPGPPLDIMTVNVLCGSELRIRSDKVSAYNNMNLAFRPSDPRCFYADASKRYAQHPSIFHLSMSIDILKQLIERLRSATCTCLHIPSRAVEAHKRTVGNLHRRLKRKKGIIVDDTCLLPCVMLLELAIADLFVY